jgi:hypothetical protein
VRFLAKQKRDVEQVFQHMDAAKREVFMCRLTEVDSEDIKDGQSQPTNPTPV